MILILKAVMWHPTLIFTLIPAGEAVRLLDNMMDNSRYSLQETDGTMAGHDTAYKGYVSTDSVWRSVSLVCSGRMLAVSLISFFALHRWG